MRGRTDGSAPFFVYILHVLYILHGAPISLPSRFQIPDSRFLALGSSFRVPGSRVESSAEIGRISGKGRLTRPGTSREAQLAPGPIALPLSRCLVAPSTCM